MSWNQPQHHTPQHDPPAARPPAGPAPWGGAAPWLHALGAVLAAFVAMAVAAWVALWLLGADDLGGGTMPALVAAVVALAVGGTVDLEGAEQGGANNDILSAITGDISLAEGSGKVDVMLLGIGLIGALILGWLFLRPLRHRVVIGALDLVVHGVRVLVFTMAALGVVVSMGKHSLPIERFVKDIGGAQDLMGIFNLGAAARFETDVTGTLVFGALWLLITLVAAVAVSARGPLPLAWLRHRAVLRAPVAGLLAVLIAAVVVGVVGTPFVAASAPAPKRMIGGMLFALPNAVWLLASLGLGIPWKTTGGGDFSFGLPGPLGELIKASGGRGLPIRIDKLADLDSRAWFVPLFSALLLLLGATVMALRAPPSVRPHQHAWRFAVTLAGGLLVVAYLMQLQLKVAVTVLGGVMSPGASLSLHADYLWTVLLGLLWGACAGFIGGAVADWVRYRKTGALPPTPAGAGPPRPTHMTSSPPSPPSPPPTRHAPYAPPARPAPPAPPGPPAPPPHSNRPGPTHRPPPPHDPRGPTQAGPWPG
ncbi:streptophobe family protein [Embleya sp. NBC_00896]|uniref:streptophobe family protein n=1 Tax=Embleya sp. NBC_00896 TaxID=2975961 RepID=UPI00386659CC|nr:streptophobe family protein [Embleya sp. NBC_00896]